MLAPGRATWHGRHASVEEAILVPADVQAPRPPIMIGGNGPLRTWRLAARFADELNLDALTPAEVEDALPVIAQRCREQDRDPASLRVSVHLGGPASAVASGAPRRDRLRAYRDLGVARVMVQGFIGTTDRGALDALIDDCAAVGLLTAGDR
jgi:hypothetical protein